MIILTRCQLQLKNAALTMCWFTDIANFNDNENYHGLIIGFAITVQLF